MSAWDELAAACRESRRLEADIKRLRHERRRLVHRCRELERANDELVEANAALRVERDAADVLLGEALDAASGSA